VRALIGALLVGACAVLTVQRLPVWRSDDALWLDAHQASPTLPRPLINVAAVALREGRIADAARWMGRAEASDRLTVEDHRALQRMRCRTAILDGDPRVPLWAGCS